MSNNNNTPSKAALQWECTNCLLSNDEHNTNTTLCKYCEAPKVEPKIIEVDDNNNNNNGIISGSCVQQHNNASSSSAQRPIEIDGPDGESFRPIQLDGYTPANNNNNNVIDLISDDEEEEEEDTSASKKRSLSDPTTRTNHKKKVKLEFEPKKFGEADDPDGDVIEVLMDAVMENENASTANRPAENSMSNTCNPNSTDAPPAATSSYSTTNQNQIKTTTKNDDDEDEVVFVSTTATMSRDLPHARHSCPVYEFSRGMRNSNTNTSYSYYDDVNNPKIFTMEMTAKNVKHCPQCYCYVCDLPARDCVQWKALHCNASDDRSDGNGRWRKERELLGNPFGRMLLLQNNQEKSQEIIISASNNNHTGVSSSSAISSQVSSIMDITRGVVHDLDEAYNSYEYGSRRYSNSYRRRHVLDMFGIFGGYYDSDEGSEGGGGSDDGYGGATYDHDFGTVSSCLRRKLHTVDVYLTCQNTSSLATQTTIAISPAMKESFIKGVMLLVEITKKFVLMEWELRERSFGRHIMDNQANKKYESTMQDICRRWIDLLLDREEMMEACQGLHKLVEDSIDTLQSDLTTKAARLCGGHLSCLALLAKNGWGESGGVMQRLRDGALKPGDEELLKSNGEEVEWVMNEPDIAKSARCRFLRKNMTSQGRQSLIIYATLVKDYESCTKGSIRSNEKIYTFAEFNGCLRFYTKIKECRTFTFDEHVQFLDILLSKTQAYGVTVKSKSPETNDDEKAEFMALLCLALVHLHRITDASDRVREYSTKNNITHVLTGVYKFFANVVSPGCMDANLPSNEMNMRSALIESDGKTCMDPAVIQSRDWVKGIIRIGKDDDLLSEEGEVHGININDSKKHAMKWLELSIAEYALLFSDGDRCYEWSKVLRDGTSGSTSDGPEIRKKPFDLAGCINTLHYVEHCLDISPTASDNFAKQWIDRVWMNSTPKITLPFEQLPLSMIERVYRKKTKWSVDFQLSIFGTISSEESFSKSAIQILHSCAMEMKRSPYLHSSYKLTDAVEKLEPHLARFFQAGDDSMRHLIAKLLTCVFELDPFHNKAFLLLDFTRSLRTESADMAAKANAVEKEFRQSALTLMEKKMVNSSSSYADTSKAKYLSIMFLFGKHAPLERLFKKMLVPSSGRSDFESWMVSIRFFSRDSIMALICKDVSSTSKLRDLLTLYNQSIEKLPAHVGYNINDVRTKKLDGISEALKLCSIATNHTDMLQPLMIPLVKHAIEFASAREVSVNYSPILTERTCTLFHRILDILLRVSPDKGKENVAALLFQIAENVQKDVDKLFPATGSPPYHVEFFSGSTRYLVFILYCDMKVYRDFQYSRFSKSLHSIFRLQDQCREFWCKTIRHIFFSLAQKLTNQEARYNYSRYDNIRPFREDRSLLPDVKDELAISALFTVGGPLEICIGIGLKYFLCDGWNESSFTGTHMSKYEDLSDQIMSISDDWNLKQRNPVLAQRLVLLSGFSSKRKIDYKAEVEKLRDLVLNKSIMVCEMKAKSSDKIYHNHGKPTNMNAALLLYQRFIAQILQCHISLVRWCHNVPPDRLRVIVANILYLWPVGGEMSGPATSKRIQDSILKVVNGCTYPEAKHSTIISILSSVQLQLCNILPASIVDKSLKSLPALVKQRVKDLLQIVGNQLKIGKLHDSTPAQQALYYNNKLSNQEGDYFERFQPVLFDIMQVVSEYDLVDDDVSLELAILADLKDGLDLNRWRSLSNKEAVSLSNFICRWTHNQDSFIDLFGMEENLSDWERVGLMKAWVSYYRRDFMAALANINKLCREPSKLNMSGLLVMLIYAGADARVKFVNMRKYTTFPKLSGNLSFPVSSCVSYCNKQQAVEIYEKLVPKMLHGDNHGDARIRYAKFALTPSLATWSAAQFPKKVEDDLFAVLLSTDPSVEHGLRFECLIPLLVIASEKKSDIFVTSLLRRMYSSSEYRPVPMCFYSGCEEEEKILGEALNSSPAFQRHYEKFVLDLCLKETFVSTSNSVATSYLAFVDKYIPNSWLRLSSKYLLTKGVASYLELEKVMEKPENGKFCQEFDWANLKAKCLRSLCPSGDLTPDNISNFVESWIHLSEMGSEGGTSNSESVRKSINQTLRSVSVKLKVNFNAGNMVHFITQLLLLAEKIPNITSADIETAILPACLIFGYNALYSPHTRTSLQNLFQTKLHGADHLQMRFNILDGLFGGLENYLNNNTVNRNVKSAALDSIMHLKTFYESSNHDKFMQRLDKLKGVLKRKKPFLKFLNENWAAISRRT